MMKRAGRILLALAVVAAAFANPAAAQTPRASLPTYALGEKSVRDDGVYTLVRIEQGEYVFAAAGRREIRLTRDLVIVEVLAQGTVVWQVEPPWPLKWPMQIGQWGRQLVSQPHLFAYGSASGSSMVIWYVEAYELNRRHDRRRIA